MNAPSSYICLWQQADRKALWVCVSSAQFTRPETSARRVPAGVERGKTLHLQLILKQLFDELAGYAPCTWHVRRELTHRARTRNGAPARCSPKNKPTCHLKRPSLLSESGMRHHPLTPMTDANLVRVLQAQLNPAKGRRVGLIDYRTVSQSGQAIQQRMNELQDKGLTVAIVDALSDEGPSRLGEALRGTSFLTAGSGLGNTLPRNWGFIPATRVDLPPARGRKAILAGSCSVATEHQVQRFIRDGGEAYALQPAQLGGDLDLQIAQVLSWADACWRSEAGLPLLVYSTAEPEHVSAANAPIVGRTNGGTGARLCAAWCGLPGRRGKNLRNLRACSEHPADADRPAD